MKLIQENLAKAADLMARLTPKKNNTLIPELNCVRLTNAPGALVLTTAHGEGGAQVRVAAANTSEPLDLLVGAQVFGDLVKTCAVGEIIELTQVASHTLNVKWPRANSHIRGIEAESAGFRHITPWNCHGVKPVAHTAERTDLTFDADVLRGVIPQVAFAAATDEQRPVLTGLLLEAESASATLAAANGFHMMQVKFATLQPAVKTRVVLPAKFCNHLVNLLSAVDDESATATRVMLSITGHTVLADYGPGVVWGQLIEGQYPDLSPIIPKTFTATARLAQGAALRVVKGAQAINKEQAVIQLRQGLFAMYASNAETGDTHPLTSAGCGDDLTVYVNPKYIGDAIRAMPKGELEIKGNGPLTPVCIAPNAEVLYVLMPLHTNGKEAPPEPQMDLFTAANMEAEMAADEAEEGVVTNAALHALAVASYSGDKLNGGKIRKPFIWKSVPYICIGHTAQSAECERLVPEAEWTGDKTTYEKAANAMRESEAAALMTKGIVVSFGAKKYVLTGERLTVALPEEVTA